MKVEFLIIIVAVIGFLSFQSAFAFTPEISVTSNDNGVITQGWSTTFNISCRVYGGYVRIYVADNGNQIDTLDAPSNTGWASGNYQYLANGGIGRHDLVFTCVDDGGERGSFDYILTEYPAGQMQGTEYHTEAQSQQGPLYQVNNNAQIQDSFHFDNGLFTLVFIGAVILTFILILALSHGGHFRRRERLEPVRQPNIFDMYRDNAVSLRPSDIRGSLPRGYDDAEVSLELPPPTKIIDSVLNDPEAKKEIVNRIAKDPVAMMEAKRIEMTDNLGRKCPRCSETLRNQNNEIVHCTFCCRDFPTTEELDKHSCKMARESGI